MTRKQANNKLRTQKDGRLFAIKLLKDIDDAFEGDYEGEFWAVPSDIIDGKVLRYPPQSQIIRKAFDRIYAATDEARAGFFVIITERLGTISLGAMNISAYERFERRGLFRKMPERQVATH